VTSIGSLCTGYGGLDMGVRQVLGGRLAWVADPEPGPATILAHHHPDVPNLGDIRAIDWNAAPPVDILAAGFPCQDISHAGKRVGIGGKRSGLWKAVAEAVRGLRPSLVVLENVAAIRSKNRGLDVVLADLAAIGYDARWTCLRAGDPETGAPHQRERWICLAHPADADPERGGWVRWARDVAETQGRHEPADRGDTPAGLTLLPTPAARDWKSGASNLLGVNSRPLNEVAVNLLPTPTAGNFNDGESLESWRARRERNKAKAINGNGQGTPLAIAAQMVALGDENWVAIDGTDYGPAIRRWENILGAAAPCPTEPGTRDNRRLNPAFAEWMMGVPGHVTGVPCLDRRQQLTAIGNGAVPQQIVTALRFLLGIREQVPV
jgi:DNA (cytosine-5)-methyltransferase 1